MFGSTGGTNSAARKPAADPLFGEACFTLFIGCGAPEETGRSEVNGNLKSDPPPKTVKLNSNNPEILA